MDLVQIVFSPTGRTQRVADILTENLGKPVRKIDLTDAGLKTAHLEREDLAVIAVPSYGGRVPALAAQRLAQVHGNLARCVAVCVYGNRAYEDTLIELKDLAEQCGFQVIAAVSAVAEHSIMHQYAAGRPDRQDQDELRSFAEKILDKLNQSDTDSASALEVPGDHPYKKAGGAGLVPKANGNCNRPLAKLSKAVKVADTSNQGKAESKAISAVAVAFRQDTESLNETDSVLHKNALSGNLSVFPAFLFGQRVLL